MTHYKPFPFTAIIEQKKMKLALILNAINPKIGGVLIKGTKGTAKTTAVRALADLLPEIRIVKNCAFNCNPDNLKEACHDCQKKILDGSFAPEQIEYKKMQVINLPINSTEDRVVGSINMKDALMKGIKSLDPGILAEANRNILYIDEVNLLADNVADVLLDSAAMGINIIEREGISFHHPSNFILIGTMNPEEGNLRPQLLDRFGLSVDIERIEDVDQRILIIKYSEEYQEDQSSFYHKFEEEQLKLSQQIVQAREILKSVTISDRALKKIVEICIAFQTDGHRADITISRTAKTIAAFNNRLTVEDKDIKEAAKLALIHRLRRLPFEDQNIDDSKIDELFDGEKEEEDPKLEEKNLQNNQSDMDNQSIDFNDLNQLSNDKMIYNTKEEKFQINKSINVDKILPNNKKRETMNTSGQRISHPTHSNRGKYIGGQSPNSFKFSTNQDIALNETLNNAAVEPENRNALNNNRKITIKEEHIQTKRRSGKSSYLIIFCIDGSGSMGVNKKMEAVKGVIFSILQKNYIYRDKVSLVVFRKDRAETILPPTRSIDLAYKLLKEIPTGGTTPLVAGLIKAMDISLEETRKKTGYIPLIILITDARNNVCIHDSIDDVLKVGEEIAKNKTEMIIIDTEHSDVRLELCKKLQKSTNAIYYHIENLEDLNQAKLQKILKIEGILERNI